MLALGLGSVATARADEAFYIIVFGSQSSPKELRLCHTWVTYVRVARGGPSGDRLLSVHTISWVPASRDVHVFAAHPEPGANLTLDQTLAFVLPQGQPVDVWAPMQIGPELYTSSVAQWRGLQRREALYQAIDRPGDDVYDCIHANTALDPRFGLGHYPLIDTGKSASEHIVREIGARGRYFDPHEDATWILAALGLGRYPVHVVRPTIAVGGCL